MKNSKKKRRRILFWTIVVIFCIGSGFMSSALYFKSEDTKIKSVQTLASNKTHKVEQNKKNAELTTDKDNNNIGPTYSDSNNEQGTNNTVNVQSTGKTSENTKPAVSTKPVVNTNTEVNAQVSIPNSAGKVVYLTFDDGPSPQVTPKVLDILKANNIKATFFTIGKMCEYNPKILLRERNEGNVIGNHSYSHDYGKVYGSVASFQEEIQHTTKIINSILGKDYKVHLVRMPGGSSGKSKAFTDEVASMGYSYVDWNCLSRDAEGKMLSPQEEFQNIVETSKGKKQVIVLMHDAGAQKSTPIALPMVINYFRSQGYEFKTLN